MISKQCLNLFLNGYNLMLKCSASSAIKNWYHNSDLYVFEVQTQEQNLNRESISVFCEKKLSTGHD